MAEKNIRISSSLDDGASKLDRAKLQRKADVAYDEGNSSIKSIIMLVIVIVLVAITGAYVVKNLQPADAPKPTPPAEEPEISPSPTVEAGNVIGSSVMEDRIAEYAVAGKTYINTDTTLKGSSQDKFELQDFSAQPYESFYRLQFDFTGNGTTNTQTATPVAAQASPVVSATPATGSGKQMPESVKEVVPVETVYGGIPTTSINFRREGTRFEEIVITFENMSEATHKLIDIFGNQTDYEIANSSVGSISYNPINANDELVFTISLKDNSKYNAQVVDNKFIVDIQEKEKRSNALVPSVTETPSVTPIVSPTVSVSPTPAATPVPTASADFVINFPAANVSATTKARISGYTFDDTADEFVYQLKLAGNEVPKVSSRLTADNKLEMKIEELSFDGLTKDGKAFTDFSAKGAKDIISMDVTFGGTASTYVYSLTERKNYSIVLEKVEGENRIVIRIKH